VHTPLVAAPIEVSVCTPEESASQRHLALNVTLDALAFFEDYFNYSYPLPQLVLAGIPDFSAGAMVRQITGNKTTPNELLLT